MAVSEQSFQCVVISPTGILLDSEVTSVIFPGHDGQVGVLKNHMPMFCELGMGLLEVETLDEAHQSQSISKQMLLDGGFAVMCENHLKIVSYDAVFPEQTSADQFDNIRRHIQKDIDSESLDQFHRQRLTRKLALLDRITPAEMTE